MTLKIYRNCKILENENFLLDEHLNADVPTGIELYLSTFSASDIITKDIQYFTPKLDIDIKIDLNDYNEVVMWGFWNSLGGWNYVSVYITRYLLKNFSL